MQPSESAVAICKILAGLRVQPKETSARNDVQSAFLELGSERTPVRRWRDLRRSTRLGWVIEGDGDTPKISRTRIFGRLQLRFAPAIFARECDDNSHVLKNGAQRTTTPCARAASKAGMPLS
jgi:hypothetical protein